MFHIPEKYEKKKTRKIVFPVPSWANKISLRDAPANPENGGPITQNTVIILLSLGIAFLCVCVCVCVCTYVCVCMCVCVCVFERA